LVPEDQKTTTFGFSTRPSTREKLKRLAKAYEGATVSAVLEGLVENAWIWDVEFARMMQPEKGYAPLHGMSIDEILNAQPRYRIWHPKRKTIGFRYYCGCEIRGDGGSYAWVPCVEHAPLAERVSEPGFVRLKPIPVEFRGGFLRPIIPDEPYVSTAS